MPLLDELPSPRGGKDALILLTPAREYMRNHSLCVDASTRPPASDCLPPSFTRSDSFDCEVAWPKECQQVANLGSALLARGQRDKEMHIHQSVHRFSPAVRKREETRKRGQ